MPAGSRTLDEEGVVIPPTRLDDDVLAVLVASMRNPDERRGDLRAQLAAQRLAERRVAELCARQGTSTVAPRWTSSTPTPSARVRPAIAGLPDGRYEAEDVLEGREGDLRDPRRRHGRRRRGRDRLRRHVAAARRQPQLPARGHALGVLLRRALPDRPDLPASGGAFAPVTVLAPVGSLVNARPPAAVAAGNVETSSRIVDVVFAAFGQAVAFPRRARAR